MHRTAVASHMPWLSSFILASYYVVPPTLLPHLSLDYDAYFQLPWLVELSKSTFVCSHRSRPRGNPIPADQTSPLFGVFPLQSSHCQSRSAACFLLLLGSVSIQSPASIQSPLTPKHCFAAQAVLLLQLQGSLSVLVRPAPVFFMLSFQPTIRYIISTVSV